MEELFMPKLGSTMTEGTVMNWLKAVGDHVAKDEPVVEIETDKVTSPIESPVDGTVSKILVIEGTTVPIGTVLALVRGNRHLNGNSGTA